MPERVHIESFFFYQSMLKISDNKSPPFLRSLHLYDAPRKYINTQIWPQISQIHKYLCFTASHLAHSRRVAGANPYFYGTSPHNVGKNYLHLLLSWQDTTIHISLFAMRPSECFIYYYDNTLSRKVKNYSEPTHFCQSLCLLFILSSIPSDKGDMCSLFCIFFLSKTIKWFVSNLLLILYPKYKCGI